LPPAPLPSRKRRRFESPAGFSARVIAVRPSWARLESAPARAAHPPAAASRGMATVTSLASTLRPAGPSRRACAGAPAPLPAVGRSKNSAMTGRTTAARRSARSIDPLDPADSIRGRELTTHARVPERPADTRNRPPRATASSHSPQLAHLGPAHAK
jgi:hypothetical protein